MVPVIAVFVAALMGAGVASVISYMRFSQRMHRLRHEQTKERLAIKDELQRSIADEALARRREVEREDEVLHYRLQLEAAERRADEAERRYHILCAEKVIEAWMASRMET